PTMWTVMEDGAMDGHLRSELETAWADKHALFERAESLAASLQAAEEERDELGPLFVRDMARLFGIAEDDYLRLDKTYEAAKNAVARLQAAEEALQLHHEYGPG